MSKQPRLELRLFGSFEARLDGLLLPRTRTRRELWLLALLALRHDRDVDRSWLAGVFWPDSSEDVALANLRRSLTALRQVLGPAADRLTSPTARSVRLEVAGAAIDVRDFDAAIQRGDLASLEQAIALYRGPLLEGCAEEWVLPERARREQAYLGALERLAANAGSSGDPAAIRFLRLIVAVDPFRETAQRLLMETLAATDQHAAAIQTYRDLRVLLHRELNSEPSPETQALFQQIRRDAHLRGSASLRPRQAHSRDTAPAGPASGQLPRPLTQTVGREEEVQAIKEKLAGARLLTLTGAGGVGKTRLAVEVAEQMRDGFPDGAWFVDLAGIQDPRRIAGTVAATMCMHLETGASLDRALALQVGSRSLLLVLDNCEHLLDACAELVQALLRDCPGVTILATSRQRLGITGELVWRVPSLSEPAAVLLFAERAAQAKRDFHLTPVTRKTAAVVCRHLDGIPLAIELAAARASVLSLAEIAARLDDRFRLLTHGSRTALPRQQTLQALIDWSYDLLAPAEQTLLRRLSVFAGGWSLDAAESVCAGEPLRPGDILDLLAALVEKSLVVFEDRDGRGRYRLLETVREYARDRLTETDETVALRDRHLDYYYRLCLQLAAERYPDRGRADYDNIMAALEWCEREERHSEVGLRLAIAESRYWWRWGYLSTGCDHLLRLLSGSARLGSEALRAAALNEAARLAFLQGDVRLAESLAQEGLVLARQVSDPELTSQQLLRLASVARARRDLPHSRALNEEALEAARQLSDDEELGRACLSMSTTATLQGDIGAARSYGEQALRIFRDEGPGGQAAMALAALARVAALEEDDQQALTLFSESLRIRSGFRDEWGIVPSLEGVAAALARLHEPARAVRLLGAADALRERLGASVLPEEEVGRDRAITELRILLDPQTYASLWLEGRTMSREDAIAEALRTAL